jgi:hypothetical protein
MRPLPPVVVFVWILALVVLRRLGCVLEPTKAAV